MDYCVLAVSSCGGYNRASQGHSHTVRRARWANHYLVHRRQRNLPRIASIPGRKSPPYLNRDVTTVQRWEKREGMPVHRHLHDRLGSVYASRAELEEWSRTRHPAASPENEPPSTVEAQPLSAKKSPAWPLVLISVLAVAALGIGLFVWLHQTEYFWRSPVADAQPQTVTDFEGVEEAAALSRDGKFVAFLSDHDGKMDVWVTQLGSGEFHNLTRGTAPELVNPSVRTLGFSPDGSLITFWARKQDGSSSGDISIWAVPTLGGQSRPYLPGVAEFDWSRDGSRLAYHTPGPGDPLFLSDSTVPQLGAKPIFTAPPGLHSHFPLWSPDSAFIYFVQGTLPDKLDIWRIRPTGGAPQRITSHSTSVTHPVFLDGRTLLYLATDLDGCGPLASQHRCRAPHFPSPHCRPRPLHLSRHQRRRTPPGPHPRKSEKHPLAFALPEVDTPSAPSPVQPSSASRISLTTGTGFSPRLGPDYLLFVSAQGSSDSIWKSTNGNTTDLWTSPGARLLGGSCHFSRWTLHRLLRPPARKIIPVRHAVRRRQPQSHRRFPRLAGLSLLGARRPIHHLRSQRSRRPSPLSHPFTDRRARPRTLGL